MTEECDENLNETFQEPQKKFWQRSLRKRTKSDAVSVSSMDISLDSTMIKRKKRKRITAFASNLLSSSSTSRLSSALQKSFGFSANNSISMIDEKHDTGPSTRIICEPAGSLAIRSWITDVAKYGENSTRPNNPSRIEIKRQEAIYELYCGENVLLDDLQVLKQFYLQPLQDTDIFSPNELRTLFGDLDMLLHIHSKIRDDLMELRDSSGFTETIGSTLLEWLPNLNQPYIERCRSQILARHILDEKRLRSKKFQEFIKKKMESPKSIDLWTYLDMPRSRIVKYPLLIKEILKRTSDGHEDHSMLKDASSMLSKLLEKIDRAMGAAECDLARMKINVKEEYDLQRCIKSAKELVTEGQLKDSKGLKLHCFLFDTCLAFTRRVTRSRSKTYNLIQKVIPRNQLKVDPNCDVNKCGFKVEGHLLTVRDEHDKKHWLDAFAKINRRFSIVSKKKSIEKNGNTTNQESSPMPRVLRTKQTLKRTIRERPI